MATPSIRTRLIYVAALLLIAAALYHGRRWFIRSWFELGPPTLAGGATARGGKARRAAARRSRATNDTARVRVVLVDGLSESLAKKLPALSRICRAGLTLRIDVGFPTVSLPVQHVLWTGAWQSQSGVMFAVKELAAPVFDSLPGGVDSVAVAERHPYIVSSFPFSHIVAPPDEKARLSPMEMERASLDAAASDRPLVFIHFLAVDEAGHKHGMGPTYRAAALRADRLLAALWQARPPDWTLVVLSDHGHHSASPGGHGGPEPEIRLVRGCLAGPGISAGGSVQAMLPDLTRIVADRLKVPPPRQCQGRTLSAVLDGGPSTPPPSPWRPGAMGLLALMLVVAALEMCRRWLRPVPLLGWFLAFPWGPVLGLLMVLEHGLPSLSRFYVYRALPSELVDAGMMAAIITALQLWIAGRKVLDPLRVTRALGVLVVLPALVTVGLTGWPVTRPPLVPYLTAWGSTLTGLAWTALVGMALALALPSKKRTTPSRPQP